MSFKVDPKWPTAIRAEEDIISWKPLLLSNKKNCYYSNIRCFPYELGYIYKETDFAKHRKGFIASPGLCSFSSLEAARRAARVFDRCTYVECIIPEGAFYFHNSVEGSYLSDVLELVKELETDDSPTVIPYVDNLFVAVQEWL